MALENQDIYPEYRLFKGLQKPLEFLGLQGRYLYWAASTAGVAIIGFILAYCFVNFIVALICASVSICAGLGLIMLKQRKGLYSKKEYKGVFIYAYSKKL